MDGRTSWQSMGSVQAIERRESEQFQSSESLIAASRLREEAGYVMDLISVLQSHPGRTPALGRHAGDPKAKDRSRDPGSREFRACRRKRVSTALRGLGRFQQEQRGDQTSPVPLAVGQGGRRVGGLSRQGRGVDCRQAVIHRSHSILPWRCWFDFGRVHASELSVNDHGSLSLPVSRAKFCPSEQIIEGSRDGQQRQQEKKYSDGDHGNRHDDRNGHRHAHKNDQPAL